MDNRKNFIKHAKRLRNYDLAVILALLGSIPLGIFLDMHSDDDFNLGDTLHNTIFNAIAKRGNASEAFFDIACASTAASALSYIGRTIDCATDEKTFLNLLYPKIQEHLQSELANRKHRNRASIAGVVLGIAMALVLILFLIMSSSWSVPLLLTAVMGGLTLISASAGLSSRLGQLVDRVANNQWNVKALNRNFELGIIGSFLLSGLPLTFLIIATAATLTSPLAIFILLASCLVLISTLTSGAHYIGLSLDYLFKDKTIFDIFSSSKKTFNTANNDKFYEKVFTTGGILFGISLGVILVSTGILMPAFLLALPALLKLPLIVFFTMNMCVSILARIGRLIDRQVAIDGLAKKLDSKTEDDTVELDDNPDQPLLNKNKQSSENTSNSTTVCPPSKNTNTSQSNFYSLHNFFKPKPPATASVITTKHLEINSEKFLPPVSSIPAVSAA